MADAPKGVPPVKASKSIKKEALTPFMRADTGGDQYDRQRSQYGKDGPPKADPFSE